MLTWFLLLGGLVASCQANNYGGRYSGYKPPYGSSNKYGYGPKGGYGLKGGYGGGYKGGYGGKPSGYGVQPYRGPVNKDLDVLPPCVSGPTRLEIVVVKPDGSCLPEACIYYTDKTGVHNTTANKIGLLGVTVKGCWVDLVVTSPEFESDQRRVYLDDCKDNKEKIVIVMQHKCNFQLWLASTDDVDYENDLVDLVWYQYSSWSSSSGGSSGDQCNAGSGLAVGGCYARPVCIYVDLTNPSTEHLNFLIGAASGANTVNALQLSHLDDYYPMGARMTMPVSLQTLIYDDQIDPADVLFHAYLNIWMSGYWDGCDASIGFDYISVRDCDENEVDNPLTSGVDLWFAILKSQIAALYSDKDIFIFIDLDVDYYPYYYEGTVSLVDMNGKVHSCEIPYEGIDDGSYDDDDTRNDIFMPFCLCQGDANRIQSTCALLTIDDDESLDTSSLFSKCEYALMCDCPGLDADRAACTAAELAEFYCSICPSCTRPSDFPGCVML